MYRLLNALIVIIVALSMAFALYYLEGVLRLDPCPLCLVDRAILMVIAAVSLVALLHNPSGIMRWFYTLVSGLFSIIGMGVAGRHIWLQGLPADQAPECGPDLAYMLEVFPLADVFRHIFTGSGQCAEVSWTFIGMTIPQQTLLLFILLFALTGFAHGRAVK